MTAKLLIVEDDPTLQLSLETALGTQGWSVRIAGTLAKAREALAESRPDLIVLDLGLPDGDGLDLCRGLRAVGETVPVLVLTARGGLDARIEGLGAGADDYLPKPFDLQELLARIHALLRRVRWSDAPAPQAIIGRLHLDFQTGEAWQNGRTDAGKIPLTALELKLLRYLVGRRGEAVPRGDILAHVWGLSGAVQTRSVDMFVSRLRKLIEPEPSSPTVLQSVRGIGYRLAES